MYFYFSAGHAEPYSRTQADAQKKGVPFEKIDLPTAQGDLVAKFNELLAEGRGDAPVTVGPLDDETAEAVETAPPPKLVAIAGGPAQPGECAKCGTKRALSRMDANNLTQIEAEGYIANLDTDGPNKGPALNQLATLEELIVEKRAELQAAQQPVAPLPRRRRAPS